VILVIPSRFGHFIVLCNASLSPHPEQLRLERALRSSELQNPGAILADRRDDDDDKFTTGRLSQ